MGLCKKGGLQFPRHFLLGYKELTINPKEVLNGLGGNLLLVSEELALWSWRLETGYKRSSAIRG